MFECNWGGEMWHSSRRNTHCVGTANWTQYDTYNDTYNVWAGPWLHVALCLHCKMVVKTTRKYTRITRKHTEDYKEIYKNYKEIYQWHHSAVAQWTRQFWHFYKGNYKLHLDCVSKKTVPCCNEQKCDLAGKTAEPKSARKKIMMPLLWVVTVMEQAFFLSMHLTMS